MLGMLEAVKGCMREQTRLDVIANNLANAATPGFKGDRVSFRDMFERRFLSAPSVPEPVAAPDSFANGMGAKVLTAGVAEGMPTVEIRTDMSQGTTRFTGNVFDLAIQGRGFFKVLTPDGIRYTRKGNFVVDSQGYLITQEGYQVMGSGGPVLISGSDMKVDETGKILVDGSEAGRLDVVVFPEDVRPIKEGNGLFRLDPTVRESNVVGRYTIQQGYLEDSNVNISREMVNMIDCMRSFESYQKALRLLDGIDDRVINQVGRVR